MSMEQAATFLAGSILTVLGFLVVLAGVLVANNLVANYWKTWGWNFFGWAHTEPSRFLTQEEVDSIKK